MQKLCTFLFSSMVEIETQRRIVVKEMMNLLPDSFMSLRTGYLEVEKKRDTDVGIWLKGFLFDPKIMVYADEFNVAINLFKCQPGIWESKTKMERTKNYLIHLGISERLLHENIDGHCKGNFFEYIKTN